MIRSIRLLIALGSTALVVPATGEDTEWPAPDADSRPWLRWWWPSDLACPESPDEELQEIASHGFGGVEVLPLGAEGDPLWPGPGWEHRAAATSRAAEKLGIGFDLATQAGPRPSASGDDDAGREWFPFRATVTGGPVEIELPEGLLHCLAAWPPQGLPINLIDSIDPETQKLVWDAPAGTWQIFGLFDEPTSSGLDPFSPAAIKDSMFSFDLSLADYDAPFPRSRPLERSTAEFSDWTPRLFDHFLAQRGYDLREQLPALFGDAPGGVVERVRCDYRETLSDLYRLSLEAWQEHTRIQGSLSRSLLQAQPGHPLEIHGVADFPGVAHSDPSDPELHLAASAAHLTMKPMVVATLTPEIPTTPGALKQAVDQLWLQGANHVIFDGRTSLLDPADGRGTLDTASGLWDHIDPFSEYVTRCQSILQLGAPDADVLLYYPAHDFWTDRGGIPADPGGRAEWMRPTGYQRCFEGLTKRGVAFDTVSDRILRQAEVVEGGLILVAGLTYQGIILPEVRRLPEQTAHRLLELTRRGARIGVLGTLPEDVPGFPNPDIRRGTLIQSFQQLPTESTLESDSLDELIEHLHIIPEEMADLGIRFVRRSHVGGTHYFIVNTGTETIDTPVQLSRPAQSVVKLDPRDRRNSGVARMIPTEEGNRIHLYLEPGESRILRTFRDREATGPPWIGPGPDTEIQLLGGEWTIKLPDTPPFKTTLLGSWHTSPVHQNSNTSTTARYELEFDALPNKAAILDLGRVAYTAEVRLNGKDLGKSFAPPHRLPIGPHLKDGRNRLEITINSLPDVNLPAGLLGPVRLITLGKPIEEKPLPMPE